MNPFHQKTWQLAKPILATVFFVASMTYLLFAFYPAFMDVTEVLQGNNLWIAAIFLSLIFALMTFLLALTFRKSCQAFQPQKIKLSEILSLYAASVVGKYLPGGVMHFVGRHAYAAKFGWPQKTMAKANLVEILAHVIVSTAIGITCYAAYLALSLTFILAIFFACLFIGLANIAKKSAGDKSRSGKLWRFVIILIQQAIPGQLLYFAGFLTINIIAATFLVEDISPDKMLALGGAYLLAWFFGLIVPGAPGGIGVREAALMILAAPIESASILIALALYIRLITIAGDMIFSILAVISARFFVRTGAG